MLIKENAISTLLKGSLWTGNSRNVQSLITLDNIVRQMFINNEQGFAYDPNDLSTMFQDAAGTAPVTGAGQTLGLILDKSKGLAKGSELLSNGDFAGGFTGWTNGNSWWSIIGGRAYHAASSTLNALDHSVPTTVLGTFLEFDAEVITASGTASLVFLPGGQVYSLNTGNSHYRVGIPVGSTVIQFKRISGFTAEFYVANVSVKLITGNHALQSTSSMRPLLQNTPRRVQYDGIDDKLTTTLPAQLTACTVIRAIPNVGCQILTNQTIATSYTDSTSHCGLIVINRALTTYETSQITKIFNKLAGV